MDLSPNNIEFAQRGTESLGSVSVHLAHSHDFLKARRDRIDVAYLGSADTGTPGYQECALEEGRLVLPFLHEGSMILFDDSPWSCGKFTGKGILAIPFLLRLGWKVLAAGYQCLLK